MNALLCQYRLMVLWSLLLISAEQERLWAQTTWRRTYGGLGPDDARSVRQTSDGGYILFGSTGSFGFGGGDMYLIKVDGDGVPLWSRTYLDGWVQTGVACREVADGFIILGSTNGPNGYDITLVKVDDTGDVLWQKIFGSADWDFASDLEVLSDGMVIVGTTYGTVSGVGNALVIRTDEQGDSLWTRSIGGLVEHNGLGAGVTSDGGMLVTGIEGVGEADENGFIVKLSSTGVLEWNKVIGGDSSDYVYDALETFSGDVVFSGATQSYSAVKQVLIGKLNSGGDSLWQYSYGSVGDSEAREIAMTSTGGYAQAVYNSAFNAGGRDMFLLLTDADGNFVLGKNYGGLDDEEGFSVQATSDGGFIVAGVTETYGPGLRAMYVVKSNASGETLDDTVYEMFDPLDIPDVVQDRLSFLTLFPNPVSERLGLRCTEPLREFSVWDVTGRRVLSGSLVGFEGQLELDLPNGTYVFSAITENDRILRRSFILQRQ